MSPPGALVPAPLAFLVLSALLSLRTESAAAGSPLPAAAPSPIDVPRGVAQLFVDDELIDLAASSDGLVRTLRRPRKDDGGNVPVIAPRGLQTLMASGTILRDPKLDLHVLFALGFWDPPGGRYQVGLYRFTSGDGMRWRPGDGMRWRPGDEMRWHPVDAVPGHADPGAGGTASGGTHGAEAGPAGGDDGPLERIEIDLRDPATGRTATNIDLCSFHYDSRDAEFPYKAWVYFANWGDDLEGVWYLRSREGKAWERVRQVVNAWAGGDDPSHREIRQDGRVLRGPGDVTIFSHDPATDRFLGIFKFYSVEPVPVAPAAAEPGAGGTRAAEEAGGTPAAGRAGAPGMGRGAGAPDLANHLRSRAYAFLDRLDEPFDTSRIERIGLLPRAEESGGDLPHDEYYASTAWRYESLWLGGLKVWHAGGDYPWSAAGCAFLKLVVSRDGLRWRKVPFPSAAEERGGTLEKPRPEVVIPDEPEVFIPNGPEGGNDGKNDGGYMTEFSQGPLRIGDELIFHYGCSSWGKSHPPGKRISGGGIFRARLRVDGFVSVDAGVLTTRPLRFEGDRLSVNAVGPVEVEALDEDGRRIAGATVSGDSIRHEVILDRKGLREVAPSGLVRLRFTVGEGGRLYAFRVE